MADYSSLGAQITALKSSINTLLAGTTNSQDLVFAATAMNTAGTMLGVNDIVAATNTGISSVQSAQTTATNAITAQQATSVAAVASSSLSFVNYFLTMGA